MSTFLELKKVIEHMFQEHPIEHHPLMLRVKENKFTSAQVKFAALQIYHVVDHFPRFISALLANIPDYSLRMPLVENLFEEHGKMNPAYVHVETYKQFLLGIGIAQEEITISEPIIPVIAYNRAVTDLCLHYPYLEGFGALGIIEEIVARVSPIVGCYAAAQFSSRPNSLVHFTDHETLDITHANEIYELAAKCYEGPNRLHIERGLQLGMYYHRRLYSDILEAAETI